MHLLDRFGCIKLNDPMENRRGTRTKIQPLDMTGGTDDQPPNDDKETVAEAREVYRLIYPSSSAETNGHAFSRDALSVIQGRLSHA